MPLKNWSVTDADNDDADLSSNIRWTEGQAPSTVNNSARAMMTQIRRFFDEIAGGTVFVPAAGVGGTGNGVTLSTDQTQAYAAGQRFMFVAKAGNTGAVTVNKDSEGTRAVKNHGAALAGGEIKTGDVVVIMDDGADYELVYPRRTAAETTELVSNDTGATEGPALTLYRNSASPAGGDSGGVVNFAFNNSISEKITGLQILADLIDATDGSEDVSLILRVMRNGTLAERLRIGSGLTTPGATGGYQGDDTINVSAVYDDGLLLRGTPIAVLQDQKTVTVDGGSFNNGFDRTRDLNTIVFDPYSLISLSANQFTLPAGNWLIKWSAPAMRTKKHQSFLYDVTAASVVERGSSEYADDQTTNENEPIDIQTRSVGMARVTPGASNTYEIRHRCERTQSTTGFGIACDFGTEVYTVVEIYAA